MHSWQQSLPASLKPSLVISDSFPEADAALSRYRDFLGHEYACVIVDCSKSLHVDAIAALAGTITAGGSLVLAGQIKDSAMWRRLQSAWQSLCANATTSATELPSLPTPEQSKLIEKLQDLNTAHVISAPRGRGKSHVLGTVIAKVKAQNPDRRIIVTAPRKANARVLLRQAADVQFVAWDKLLEIKKGEALLVIDEAAGLPLWAIQQLCQQYTPWLMATTVEGYEGCGRGFAIHFPQWAESHLSNVQTHSLKQPIRWLPHDPLEQWLQDALLLTNAPATVATNDKLVTVRASELPEPDLHQAFELLLTAHYQSSPNDLALLLDDSHQFVTLLYRQHRVVGVCWHALEGPLEQALQEPIMQGRRRPPGNLLPQAIGFYLQQSWALNTRWCRITRIAVASDYRRRHLASELIHAVKKWSTDNNCQALGTSFGYSDDLARFWRYNNFSPIRTSSKRDRVSARHQHIQACWLLPEPPPNWQDLLEYAKAELLWTKSGKTAPMASNVVIRQILQAVDDGYMPAKAATFAMAQRQ